MSSTPNASTTLRAGAVFHGRYRVLRCLKAGEMGAVYEVVDDNTASPRALKVMLPSVVGDADQRARFTLEARVTGNIDSDHLVRVSDSGVDESTGSPFLVMELLRGEELGDLLERQKTLPPAEVVTYLTQASLALDKTHAAGVVHRDLKPQNLFVTRRDDGAPCVKILDFGIAKVIAASQAQKTRALGTPLFMAPEQVRGESDIGPRADLYALAQVAYTLLVGEAYWMEESQSDETLYALLVKLMSGAEEAPSARALRRKGASLPAGFDAWFLKATAAKPEGRFDRATVQTAALAEILTPPVVAPAPVTAAPPRQPTVAVVLPAPVPIAAPSASLWLPMSPPPAALVSPSHTPPPHASPSYAPPPYAGASGSIPSAALAAPAQNKGLLIALVAVGSALALGLLVLLVSLLGRGAAASTASAGCPATATCANLDISDLAHVDAQALYPAVEKLAKASDGRAAPIMISGELSRDGTADLSGDKSIMYQFAIPGGTVAVNVRGKQATVMRTNPFGAPIALPEPRCSTRAAWKAAVGAGMVTSGAVSAVYANDISQGVAAWGLTAARSRFVIDGKTCAVRASNKW